MSEGKQTEKPGIREILTDALRFWEWRRPFYNLTLAVVVLLKFAYLWPSSKVVLNFDALLGMFLLAVLANIAYCAAYLIEVLVQYSEFREAWRKNRIILWIVGTTFASVLAHFFTDGMFGRDLLPNPALLPTQLVRPARSGSPLGAPTVFTASFPVHRSSSWVGAEG